MIPLNLITGFLGSGKTTLLARIIARHRDRRLVYLVNEFGAVDIDGRLIELEPGQLLSIPGGSIFCRCLTGEFIRVLGEAAGGAGPRSLDVVDQAPDGVVIEASGIADPKIMGQMLAETRLDRVYQLRHIITVIDPGSFLKLVHTLPNIIAQVQAADLAVINKTDLYGAEQIAAAERAVRQINPDVHVVRTQHCEIDFDATDVEKDGGPSQSKARSSLGGQYAACADPNYVTRAVSIDQPVEREPLLDVLRALQPDVYRIKGFVPTPAGAMYVDVSAGGVTCEPAPNPDTTCDLIFITSPQHLSQVENLIQRLQPRPGLRIL